MTEVRKVLLGLLVAPHVKASQGAESVCVPPAQLITRLEVQGCQWAPYELVVCRRLQDRYSYNSLVGHPCTFHFPISSISSLRSGLSVGHVWMT